MEEGVREMSEEFKTINRILTQADYDDMSARQQALEFATRPNGPMNTTGIIEQAQAFYAFLKGGA